MHFRFEFCTLIKSRADLYPAFPEKAGRDRVVCVRQGTHFYFIYFTFVRFFRKSLYAEVHKSSASSEIDVTESAARHLEAAR